MSRRTFQALSLLLALFIGQASAQTWTGGGANDNWSTGANWAGGVAPPSAATTDVRFPLAARLSPVVDAPWTINRMEFSTGGYSLSGQPITFSGATPQVMVGISAIPNRIANPLVLTGPTTVSSLGFLDFLGGISGTGPVLFAGGPGFTGLAGSNTFTGGATVAVAHVLSLFGGSMPGPVTVNDGGTLSGGGVIAGSVTVNGTPAGGLAPNPLHGTLRTGNLSNSAAMRVVIGGSAQGTQFSHVDVVGNVNLANPWLILFGSFVPPEGAVFTIITNDGTDPVTGTFFSLPEGSTVIFNGVRLVVSYVGGTGNDVTLAAVGLPIGSEQAPTLSQWALLLLAALLGVLGARQLSARSPGR